MDRSWDGRWHTPKQLLRFIARSAWRLGVLIVGLAVTAAGLAMVVLPGPAFLVIPIGLAILATEFTWAEYLLDKAKAQAAKAAKTAKKGLFSRFRRVKVEVDVEAGTVTKTVEITERIERLDPERSGVVDDPSDHSATAPSGDGKPSRTL